MAQIWEIGIWQSGVWVEYTEGTSALPSTSGGGFKRFYVWPVREEHDLTEEEKKKEIVIPQGLTTAQLRELMFKLKFAKVNPASLSNIQLTKPNQLRFPTKKSPIQIYVPSL